MLAAKRGVQPLLLHYIWDVLARNNGRITGSQVFLKLLTQTSIIPKDIVYLQLKKVVREGLVFATPNFVVKGKEELVTYGLPDPTKFKKGDHDWYCFRCHKEGQVVQCQTCPRVYHLDCLADERKPKENSFTCPSCHVLATKPSMEGIEIGIESLNKALLAMINLYAKRSLDEHKKANGETFAKASKRPKLDAWRFQYLIYFTMDWETMQRKASNRDYVSLDEFVVDFETMLHGIAVYFGEQVQRNFPVVLSEIVGEFRELKLCADCYEKSFRTNKAFWACLPCAVPHDVVWTPRDNTTFWPAKVLKKDGNMYQIRYFGDDKLQAIDAGDAQLVDDSAIDQIRLNRTSFLDWTEAYKQFETFREIAKSRSFQRMYAIEEKAGPSTGKRSHSDSPLNDVTKMSKLTLATGDVMGPPPPRVPGSTSASETPERSTSINSKTATSYEAPLMYALLYEGGSSTEPFTPIRRTDSTEGARDLINFFYTYAKPPLCCYCLVDNGVVYCCQSLVFCSNGCKDYHLKKYGKAAHLCISHNA